MKRGAYRKTPVVTAWHMAAALGQVGGILKEQKPAKHMPVYILLVNYCTPV